METGQLEVRVRGSGELIEVAVLQPPFTPRCWRPHHSIEILTLLSSTAFHSFDLAMRVGKNPQFEIAC